MASLKEVLDASAVYWSARIETMQEQLVNEISIEKEEETQVATSLSNAISIQLESLKAEISSLNITGRDGFDETVRDILNVDIMASSIEMQAGDYLAMMSSSDSSATTAASSPSPVSVTSHFTSFLNRLLSALGSLQKWLFNILRHAATVKEWTISGSVSTGSLGLMGAELSITFEK